MIKLKDILNEYDTPYKFSDKELENFSLNKLKIQIEASDAIDRHQMEYVVSARYLDTPVGMIEYSTYSLDKKPTAHIQNVLVFEKLRRKGIANALYDFVKKNQKLEIKTFGNIRTADGVAFRKYYDSKV